MNTLRLAGVLLVAAAASRAAVDPALLNLVMPDAKILSGIQVDQSQSSPFGQYIRSQMQIHDADFEKFIAATGFDPRRDLNEILAASTGDPTAKNNNAVVLGRGAFRPGLISSAAAAAGATVTRYRGFDILTPPEPGSPPSVVFLDASTAAMGPADAVKGTIDRRLTGSVFSGSLAQKANAASAANQAWFVTLTPLSEFLNGKLGANANLNNITQSNLLQTVLESSGGLNFGSNAVTITADAVTSSNQNAQALADVMKFLVSLVQNPKLGSLADAATFTANGAVMHMTMSLPEQQIEQLFVPRAAQVRKGAARQ